MRVLRVGFCHTECALSGSIRLPLESTGTVDNVFLYLSLFTQRCVEVSPAVRFTVHLGVYMPKYT